MDVDPHKKLLSAKWANTSARPHLTVENTSTRDRSKRTPILGTSKYYYTMTGSTQPESAEVSYSTI